MIYLDNAATTKPCQAAIQAVKKTLEEEYFNPSALYYPAIQVKSQIDAARAIIAEALGCKPNEIVFTSGATEANNWAVVSGFKNKRGNIVISAAEHPSVYEPAMSLKSKGADVRIAPIDAFGCVEKDSLLDLVDENTALVSVMNVSNEIGAINKVIDLAESIKKKNPKTVFHSDGVQAFCKIPTPIGKSAIDLYSISAHKIGGIKGIGALYISDKLNLAPFIHGGGQERQLRSGTENAPGIIAFGAAVSSFDANRIAKLYNMTLSFLSDLKDVKVNGRAEMSSGYIISVGVRGVKSEVLQHMLCDDGVLVGLGSACSSKTKKNRVLESMKVDKSFIEGNIRISFSPENTVEEVETALPIIKKNIDILRNKIHG